MGRGSSEFQNLHGLNDSRDHQLLHSHRRKLDWQRDHRRQIALKVMLIDASRRGFFRTAFRLSVRRSRHGHRVVSGARCAVVIGKVDNVGNGISQHSVCYESVIYCDLRSDDCLIFTCVLA